MLTFQRISVSLNGFNGFWANEITSSSDSLGVDFLELPFDRDLSGAENVNYGLTDFWADTVTREQGDFEVLFLSGERALEKGLVEFFEALCDHGSSRGEVYEFFFMFNI